MSLQQKAEASCDLEKRQFKELYPDVVIEDEAIFKRPRGKVCLLIEAFFKF